MKRVAVGLSMVIVADVFAFMTLDYVNAVTGTVFLLLYVGGLWLTFTGPQGLWAMAQNYFLDQQRPD